MNLIAVHINYYMVCKRMLWLFSNGIGMEHTSDFVAEGALLHETSYPQRAERYTELEIDGCKIDFYDSIKKVVHEIKRSNQIADAHRWQVKYYIFILERNGIDGATGLLSYPLIKQTEEVFLTDEDRNKLAEIVLEIPIIIESEICPACIHAKICKKCSYFDFCYATE